MKKNLATLMLSAMASVPVFSATIDWNPPAAGSGGSVTWATNGNWTGGTAPSNDLTTDIARFNSATTYLFAPNAGTTNINGLEFGDGTTSAVSVTLAGTALTIGNGGITKFANSGAVTISSPLKLGANQNWANNSSTLLTISGAISNVADTTPFTVTLNGSGTGGTTISSAISNAGTTGTTAININTTGGATTLSAANTFTGGLNIQQGTVKLGNSTAAGAGLVTIGNTGTSGILDLNGASRTIVSLATAGTATNQKITNNTGTGTLNYTGAVSSTFGGVIENGTGTTAVSVNATGGSLTLSGANTYSGTTTVSNGTLIMSGTNSSNGATTASGGILTLANASNGGLASGLLTLSNGTLQATTASPVSLSNAVTLATGSGGYNVGGSQSITLDGDVNFTGQPSKGFVNNMTGGATLTLNGAFLNLNNTTTNVYATYSGNNASGTTIINSVIQTGVNATNPGSINHGNIGILTLAGANTYSGGTTLGVANATLRINNGGTSSTNSAIGTGTFTITAGTIDNTSGGAITLATNNAQTWNGNFAFTGTNDLNLGTGAVSLGTTAGTARTVTTTAGNLTVGGVISNGTTAIGLTKAGAGTLTLTGASTYTGPTTVSAGTLSVTSLNSVNSGSASSIGAPTTSVNGTIALGSTTNAAQLTYTGSGETTDRVINLAGTTGGGAIDQSGTGLLKFTSSFTATGAGIKTLTLQGSTAGTGEITGAIVNNSSTNKTSVTKNGTGTWTLSGANTYTGTTTVNAGTLALGVANAISASSPITLNGGTLSTGGFNQTLGVLTLSAASTIDLGSGTSLLAFANSSAATWGSVTLSFINVDGGDTIRFGTTNTGIDSTQLSKITINGFAAIIDSSGYLTSAIPEPSTYALLAGSGLLLFSVVRRKPRAALVS